MVRDLFQVVLAVTDDLVHDIVSVAVTSFWAYDYFLTLADEVVFLTQSQWKWAKLLYIVCRYLTCGYLSLEMLVALQPTMSIRTCQTMYYVNTYLGSVIMVCAEGVFMTRACAMWEFRRCITAILLISGLIYIVTGHVVLSLNRSAPIVTKSPIPVTSCFDTGDGSTIIVVYAILAVAEIQIWMFTLYKAITSYWREGTHNRLLGQLILQNLIYMTCGLLFSITVILTTALVKAYYGFMIVKFVRIWQVTIHAFLVTRMSRELWRVDQQRALLEPLNTVSPETLTQRKEMARPPPVTTLEGYCGIH
ncbi:hypothetical protein DEU56DRAFT_904339 [Suillus clintonianus]|uniref:uncharacterized protein n=1 Tax=Suillus clintonianus TaxID=1904413 RepID=UPI001B8640D0|nr:uncharacterized protein DEU56DRAFT_904339 [Suillus clintonianus]KAG2122782.1 hypothetical protein DEU56DRAFT_904339 [Suillus clintonianus]